MESRSLASYLTSSMCGRLQGFDVYISLEIANRLGVEAELVTTAFDTIVGGLQAKRYDTILGSLAITAERTL